MKKKQNYKRGGGLGDTAVKLGSTLVVAYVGGYIARGIKKAVVETKFWQEKAGPWIEKKYNDLEDMRDQAIDNVRGIINKKA